MDQTKSTLNTSDSDGYNLPNQLLDLRLGQAERNPLIQGRTWNIADKNTLIAFKLNLLTLSGRRGGERYWVDESTGLLQPYKGLSGSSAWLWNKLKRVFSKPNEPTRTDQKVKAIITGILQHLGTQPYGPENRKALTELFTEKLKDLNEKVYDRSKIPLRIINLIKPVELSGLEISRHREKLSKNHLSPSELSNQVVYDLCSNETEYNLRIQEVLFALSLGVDFIPNKNGTSGNYICRDWTGKSRLLFKPDDEGPDSVTNPHWVSKIKNIFWSMIPFFARRTCYPHDQNHISEVAASKMLELAGLNINPKTEMKDFKSKVFTSGSHEVTKHGSCQVWIDPSNKADLMEAYKAFDLFNPWWLPFQIPLFIQTWFMNQTWLREALPGLWNLFDLEKKKETIMKALPPELFDLLVIAHMLTGNGDGHPANYLLLKINDIVKVMLIDFGWSFPHSHPSDYLALRFLYDFRYLPQAHGSFGKDALDIIQRIREHAPVYITKIGKFIQDNQVVHSEEITSLDPKKKITAIDHTRQMKMMWERLQPLFKALDNEKKGIQTTIRDIASVRSPEEFDKFFKDNPDYERVPAWLVEAK